MEDEVLLTITLKSSFSHFCLTWANIKGNNFWQTPKRALVVNAAKPAKGRLLILVGKYKLGSIWDPHVAHLFNCAPTTHRLERGELSSFSLLFFMFSTGEDRHELCSRLKTCLFVSCCLWLWAMEAEERFSFENVSDYTSCWRLKSTTKHFAKFPIDTKWELSWESKHNIQFIPNICFENIEKRASVSGLF